MKAISVKRRRSSWHFVYNIGIDETYNKIYDGQWLNNKPYGYIHRIAGDGKTKGVGSFCINWAFEKCGNIKIDTHADNKLCRIYFLN